MTRAQALVDAQRALRSAFPDRWTGILAALERRVLPQSDAPECPNPACRAPTGTPIREAGDLRYSRRHGNLFCPACGEEWTGDADAVAQAIASAKAYHEAQEDLNTGRMDTDSMAKMIAEKTAVATCEWCQHDAACIGTSEGDGRWAFACNECCGHDNEDGTCYQLRGEHPAQGKLFGKAT